MARKIERAAGARRAGAAPQRLNRDGDDAIDRMANETLGPLISPLL